MATSSRELTWQSQQTSTYRTLEKMRRERILTDLIIECENKEFHVHRVHVCSSIPFFAAMFEANMEEANKGKANLKSISAAAMEIILDFVYTGTIAPHPVDNKELFYNILHATNMLQIETLFDFYIAEMCKAVTGFTFVEMIELTELYNCQEILAKLHSGIADSFQSISVKPEFVDLTLPHLKEILRQPEINNSWGDGVLKGILKWVQFKEDERASALEDLIITVRLDKLSNEYLDILLNEDPLVRSYPVLFNSLVPLAFSRLNKPQQPMRLLAFGNKSTDAVTASFISELNLESMTWDEPVELPFKIDFGSAVAAKGDDVYFAGGGGSVVDYTPLTSVVKYSRKNNSVLNHSSLKIGVNQAAAVVLNDHLYVVGGRGKTNGNQLMVKNLQRINTGTGRHTLLAPTNNTHNLPSVLTTKQYVYVAGSGAEEKASIEQYDILENSWTVVSHIPGEIKWSRAAILMDKLYVIRKWEEREFHVYDFERKNWEIKEFLGGPVSSNGIWAISRKGCQHILVKEDKKNTLYIYNVHKGKWSKETVASNHPWFWPCSVIV